MLPLALQPTAITDLVFNMENYIDFMRTLPNDDAVECATNLEEYIVLYFRDERIDKAILKKSAVEMVNKLYLHIMSFDIRDAHVDAYFDIVLGSLFDQIREQQIHIFFILDNDMEDDRFILVKELFELMLFTVITPYERTDIEPDPVMTKLPGRHYGLVEEDILSTCEDGNHLLYIEKDATTSYIQRILDLAQKEQTTYQCLYRNQPITNEKALWLRGQFKTEVSG